VALNLTWVQATLLSAAQHAATVAIPILGGNAAHLYGIDWETLISLSGGSAIVSILIAVVAYGAKSQAVTAALSTTTAGVQAIQALTEPEPVLPVTVHDERGARG
jgi:hypothetical protein